MSQTLIARLLEQRDSWIDLGEGARVKVRRPAEAELASFMLARREPDTYLRCVVGGEGFTEATLRGPAIGASDPVPFDAEVWLTAARDRTDWITAVSAGVADALNAHLKAKGEAAKN